jgi:NitT/TauT family transport system substrate-binding protein
VVVSHGSRGRLATLLACLAVAGVATGCGGDEESGGGAAQAEGGDAPVTVKLAYQATASDAAMVLGEKKGFFDEAGIDLQLHEVPATGAAAIPALVAGEFAVAGGGIDAPILAAAKGLPVKILASGGLPVSKGHTYPEGSKEGTSAIVVPKDSDIKTVEDIKGAKLAAITVSGLQYLCIAGDLEKHGLGPDAVDILEIPPQEMLTALESGRVDAATLVEPFLAQARQQGYRVVSFPCEESIGGAIQAGFYTSAKWAEENPDGVRRLTEALVRSNEYAEANPEEMREVIPEFTAISPELAQEITLSRFETSGENTLGVVAEAVRKFDFIEEMPDLDSLLVGS